MKVIGSNTPILVALNEKIVSHPYIFWRDNLSAGDV